MGYIVIFIIKVLSFMKLRTAQQIGQFIGMLLYERRCRSREVALVNLKLVYPEINTYQRQHLLKQTLIENGKVASEMGPMWGYPPAKTLALIHRVYDQQVLTDALNKEGGTLILVPHLGNWEILNHFLCSKTDVMAMYRPAKMESFNRWMTQRRSQTGLHLVTTSRAGIECLFDRLNEGGFVAVLPDQEPKEEYGVFAPFMGIETLTPKLPYELIQKTKPTVMFGFAVRLPNAEGFDIHFREPGEAIYSNDKVVACAELNRMVEDCIKQAPAQYQWTYKRFKRKPDNQPNPYKEAKVP